jgi:hypothetical protein
MYAQNVIILFKFPLLLVENREHFLTRWPATDGQKLA